MTTRRPEDSGEALQDGNVAPTRAAAKPFTDTQAPKAAAPAPAPAQSAPRRLDPDSRAFS